MHKVERLREQVDNAIAVGRRATIIGTDDAVKMLNIFNSVGALVELSYELERVKNLTEYEQVDKTIHDVLTKMTQEWKAFNTAIEQ